MIVNNSTKSNKRSNYQLYYPQIIEHEKDHDHAVGNPSSVLMTQDST